MEAEAILQMLRQEQKRHSTSSTTSSDLHDMAKCGLDNVDCPVCGNTGTVIVKGDKPLEIHSFPCECMKKRLSLRSLKKAGMEDMAKRYSMDSYQADNPQRQTIKTKAQRFIDAFHRRTERIRQDAHLYRNLYGTHGARFGNLLHAVAGRKHGAQDADGERLRPL